MRARQRTKDNKQNKILVLLYRWEKEASAFCNRKGRTENEIQELPFNRPSPLNCLTFRLTYCLTYCLIYCLIYCLTYCKLH